MNPTERHLQWKPKCSLCSWTPWPKARMDFLGYDERSSFLLVLINRKEPNFVTIVAHLLGFWVLAEFVLPLQVSHSSLSGLRSWKNPVVPSASFSARQFRVFLPPKNKLEVGNTWWVIPSELNIFTGYLPNNRYHPPSPKGKEVKSAHRRLTEGCLLTAVSIPGSHSLLAEHVPSSALH